LRRGECRRADADAVDVNGQNETVDSSNVTIDVNTAGASVTANGSGDTLYEAADNAFSVAGGNDSVVMGDSGDYLGLLGGSGYSVLGNGGTIDTLANTSFNLALPTCAGVASGFSRTAR